MNIEHYNNFEQALQAGLKKQAAHSVQLFVNSFQDEQEVSRWVWEYLPRLDKNCHSCIRHELFVHLVYPTLKKGFAAGDYQSTLWLGRLTQNIYQTKGVFAELGSLLERDFYRKCYAIDPYNSEGNQLLLGSILDWLSHCVHEWPAGILYGMDCATIEQIAEIRREAGFALTLATAQNDREFIVQFLDKLNRYEQRLNQ